MAGGGVQSAPDGAAQLTGTYSCVASPTGGLMAGPLKVQSLQQGLIDAASNPIAYIPGDQQMHVLAFRNFSPVNQQNQGIQGTPIWPDQPWVTYQWFTYTNAPTNTLVSERVTTRTYFPYWTSISAGSVGASQYPFTNPNPAGYFYDAYTKTNSGVQSTYTPDLPQYYLFGSGTIDNTRANNAFPNLPGSPSTVFAFSSGSLGQAATNIFPKSSTPGVNSTDAIAFSSNNIGFVFSHQDRIIGLRNDAVAQYGTSGNGPSSEIMEFTNANNYSVVTTSGTVFVSEHPTGYGSWVSMNANQLMLVKQRGGGVSVTGALENPTVTYLPGIPSTLGATNLGTIGPNGEYIYGTDRGVFSWTGGDSAQCISNNLDGWFWRAFTDRRLGLQGQFGFLYPYVFAPNNFLYDTRTGGWWRLNLPSSTQQTYAFWDTSATGLMLGCASTVSTNQTEAIAWYDPSQGQASYQWTSQPLQKSRGRFISIRQVSLLAMGSGTVTISITGLDNAPTPASTQTFTVNSGNTPSLQTLPIACKGTDLVVTIASTSGSTTTAPRVNRVSFDYDERETAR